MYEEGKNVVGFYRKVSTDKVKLEYRSEGEVLKDITIKTGQKWKLTIDGNIHFVVIDDFLVGKDEAHKPITAFLKTDSDFFNSPDNMINGRPAYSVSLLTEQGELVK